MEQQGKKKEWVAPELLVLVRSHPEEAVLSACKNVSTLSGPTDSFLLCLQSGCSNCSALATS
jgi:hypothetical protein